MSDQITYAYAGDIEKSYDEDGDLIVVGKATGPDLDLDEQVCDPTWLREAMPAWMKFGNLREMHQPVAAGVGLELTSDGDDWHLKSRVIDPMTKAKIEAGALKGYSIGIKGAKVVKDGAAPGGRIVGGTVVEVSYVDRPCNPTAVTTIAKGAGLAEAVESTEAERSYKYDDTNGTVDAEWQPEDTYQSDQDGATDSQKPGEYPSDHLCRKCDGLGKLPETGETCPKCNGTGRVDEKPQQAGKPTSFSPDENPKDAEPDTEKVESSAATLRAAVKAIGEMLDASAAIAHIESRAKALGQADLEKVEHDEADLNSVRSGMIALIKAELDEMLGGEEDEIGDVSNLLCALQLFLSWWDHEATEGETAAPFTDGGDATTEGADMDLINLGVSADTIKAVQAGEAEPDAIKDELTKALGIEAIREEIAKAAKQGERIEFLEAELERVKTLAAPGGPAITRTQAQAHKSAEVERIESDAARYFKMAEQVEDPTLASQYRTRAEQMQRDALKIANA